MTIKMMHFVCLLVSVIARQAYGDEPEAIVGGQLAVPGQFKYQVSILKNNRHNCGGSIISPIHIVTAAHCVPDASPKYYTIVTGTTKWKQGEKHEIKCIRVHPNYINFRDNDVAVITLKNPITFNGEQGPISLASKDYRNDIGTPVVVSGWGRPGKDLPIPDNLSWVGLKINACRADKTSHHICTFLQTGKGFCQGDSGGPLVANGELIGVVSHNVPCAIGYPDVYANVFPFKDFIKESQKQC